MFGEGVNVLEPKIEPKLMLVHDRCIRRRYPNDIVLGFEIKLKLLEDASALKKGIAADVAHGVEDLIAALRQALVIVSIAKARPAPDLLNKAFFHYFFLRPYSLGKKQRKKPTHKKN